MKQPNEFFEEMQAKFSEWAQNSPAKDFEKNIKATIIQAIDHFDLVVTREAFDIQAQILARTRERLEILEEKIRALEGKIGVFQNKPVPNITENTEKNTKSD